MTYEETLTPFVSQDEEATEEETEGVKEEGGETEGGEEAAE